VTIGPEPCDKCGCMVFRVRQWITGEVDAVDAAPVRAVVIDEDWHDFDPPKKVKTGRTENVFMFHDCNRAKRAKEVRRGREG